MNFLETDMPPTGGIKLLLPAQVGVLAEDRMV